MFPVQQVPGQLERSSCSRYELDLVQNLSALGTRPSLDQVHNMSALGSSPEILLLSLKQEGCKDGWNYSTEYYQSTVVSEVLSYCFYYCEYGIYYCIYCKYQLWKNYSNPLLK